MNRKESALVCILFFIYPSEDIVYICDKMIVYLFVTKNALPLQSLKKQRKQIYEYYYSK